MSIRTLLLVALMLLIAAPATLQAKDDREKLKRSLASDEAKARKKAAKAAEGYADWCADCGAYEEARVYLNVVALLLREEFGGKDFDKLRGQEDEVDEDYAEELEDEREDLLKGGKDLFEFIVDARKEDGDEFSREASAIWITFFYNPELLDEEGWVYNEYIGRIMPEEDAAKFDTHGRYHGEWLDGAEVEKHNSAHGDFKDPTVLSDGCLELHSEMWLKQSLRLMNYASRFRVFLLSRIGGQLELQHPEGLLKIYAAIDRESYEQRGRKITAEQGVSWPKTHESGKYLGVAGEKLNPILFSPDVPVGDGTCIRGSEMATLNLLQHEMVHMLCVEGLKHDENDSWSRSPEGPPPYNSWVYEGLATWMENFFWSDEELRFERVLYRKFTLNKEKGKANECRLGRAAEMGDRIKPMQVFAKEDNDAFRQGGLDAYAQTCAQTMFLLQHSVEMRERFFKLARMVHTKNADKESFEKVFEDANFEELNAGLKDWIGNLEFKDD